MTVKDNEGNQVNFMVTANFFARAPARISFHVDVVWYKIKFFQRVCLVRIMPQLRGLFSYSSKQSIKDEVEL